MFLTFILILVGQATTQSSPPQQVPKPPGVEAAKSEPEIATKVLQVRRIYVDSFGDDQASRQMQAMIINALTASKKFIITENRDKADAILKGSTVEEVRQEVHSSSESTRVKSAAISDSSHSTETIHEASIAVRLVAAADGDVIWSTTKESKGAKYKGASADVADQVVKQLLGDIARLQSQSEQKEPSN
jgi:curli biogenesis system outer membrane secretion channel CsgG